MRLGDFGALNPSPNSRNNHSAAPQINFLELIGLEEMQTCSWILSWQEVSAGFGAPVWVCQVTPEVWLQPLLAFPCICLLGCQALGEGIWDPFLERVLCSNAVISVLWYFIYKVKSAPGWFLSDYTDGLNRFILNILKYHPEISSVEDMHWKPSAEFRFYLSGAFLLQRSFKVFLLWLK